MSVTLLGPPSLEVDVLMYIYIGNPVQAVVEEVVVQRSVNSRHAQLHRMLWFPFPFTFLAHGYNTYCDGNATAPHCSENTFLNQWVTKVKQYTYSTIHMATAPWCDRSLSERIREPNGSPW